MIRFKFILLTMVLACALLANGTSLSIEKRVKSTLLSHLYIGGPSHIEMILQLQRQEKLSDEQMRSILIGIINNTLINKDDHNVSLLKESAIDVISKYSDDKVNVLLRDAITNNKGPLRHSAIRSYLSLVNIITNDLVTTILTDYTKYDDSDRRIIYKQMIDYCHNASEEEKKQVLSKLNNAAISEDDKSNYILLDRFLVIQKADYVSSTHRLEALNKYKQSPGKDPNEADQYIEHELLKLNR
jgi:hypothetical protein